MAGSFTGQPYIICKVSKAMSIDFKIENAKDNYLGKHRKLYSITRKVLGKDTANYQQKIGDSVAFVGKNIVEYLECVQILLGEYDQFKPVDVPYIYHYSRNVVGQTKLKGSDGSTAEWLNKTLVNGVLNGENRAYSNETATKAREGDKSFQVEPDIKLIKNYAKLSTLDDIGRAIYHGYPVAIFGNQAFQFEADKYGIHQPDQKNQWNHCYTVIGFDSHPKFGLSFDLLNSWGDVHGRLKDFRTGEELPIGVLRLQWNVVADLLKDQYGEAYAYTPYDNFIARADKIDAALKH